MAAFSGPFAGSQQTSTLISSMDYIHKPQVFEKLVGRFPKQFELGWLKEYGLFQEVKGQTYFWHEENRLLDNPLIASIAQIGATNGIRVTLAAASHQSGGTVSYPRVGLTVRFANGKEGRINAKSVATPGAHTIDVYPNKSSLTYLQFSTGIAANTQFILPGNSFAEITTGQKNITIPTTTVYQNKIQKFSELYKVTQSEIGNETYIDFAGPNGENGKALYYKGLYDTEKRFMFAQEMALFCGQSSEAGLVDEDGNAVNTTEGMMETLDLRGTQQTWTVAITIDFYDQVTRKIKKNHGGSDYTLLMGQDFSSANTKFLMDLGNSGSIVYANGGSDKIIDATFGKFIFNGYNFKFKEMEILTNPELLGTDNFGYSSRAVFMPDPKSTVFIDKQGVSVKPFTVKYKKRTENARDNGKYAMAELGFNAKGGATNDEDSKSIKFYSDLGAATAGALQFINVTKI